MKKVVLAMGVMICMLHFIQNDTFCQSFVPARIFGEESLLQDFLCAEVTYPAEALFQGTEGTVILSFTITEKGQIKDLQVKQPVSPEIDAEAIRMFNMLLWEPAVKLGNPVTSMSEFQVKFDIKKYKKHCKLRGYDKTILPYAPVDTSNRVYDPGQVDKPPYAIFTEKGMTLGRFINDNIRYPETAYRQSISGKVVLSFVVEPHGRVSNIRILEPVSGGCTQEAIRLLELVEWMPGIKEDMAVRTFMNLEINFKLPEDSDLKMFENSQMNSN